MSQSSLRLLIWDLDGTLVDSLPETFAAFNAGLKPFLGRELSAEEIMSHFGPPDQEILRRLVGDADADECYNLMYKHMLANLDRIQPFEGILDTIENLASKGYEHAIFTGRGRKTTDLILKNLKIERHFGDIITNDDVVQFKPHPEGIFKICRKLNVEPVKSLMIGDSTGDIKAARSAGCHGTISCLWDKHAKRHKVEPEAPFLVVQHPSEIAKLL